MSLSRCLLVTFGCLALLTGVAAAQMDECDGLNRYDCNFHPNCETFQGEQGNCYFVYHSFCNCRALQAVIADVCDLSVELADGDFDLYYPIEEMANDYTPGSYPESCTGFSAEGPDGTAYVFLEAGGTVEAHMQGSMDASLYVVTDCTDPAGTCVAGVDETLSGAEEQLTYEAASEGYYYIIFDAYTASPSPGLVHVWGTVTGSVMTPVRDMSWGTIKAMYR